MKRLRPKYVRWSLLACLLAGVFAFRAVPGAGEAYARVVYPAVSSCLSGVASVCPVSLCEILVIGVAGFLLLFPFVARRRKAGWRAVLAGELEVLAWIYVWFYWGWGLNYFRDDFFLRSGTQRVEYEEGRFVHFLRAYADSLNASFCPSGALAPAGAEAAIKEVYRTVPAKFGLGVPRVYQHPKQSLVNGLYSSVGVLGYMGPFFDESHVNRELLPVQYPFTYAHELSHLLGVSSEAEANFWAYQVCIRSESREVRYSGRFGLLPYVIANARKSLGPSDYEAWVRSIRPEVLQELSAKQAYWARRHNRLVGAVQDAVYDWFLKGNRIASGQKNYAEVVAMVLSLPENWWK